MSYIVSKNILIRKFENESALINISNGHAITLNDTGTVIFEQISATGDLEKVYQFMIDNYDANPNELYNDILSLLNTLVKAGIIQQEEVETQ